ncbi:MAG: hypothetical protein IKR13_05785 [Victivallales bacterium]|nr:hypothetical protein [Victivallales bacterium]
MRILLKLIYLLLISCLALPAAVPEQLQQADEASRKALELATENPETAAEQWQKVIDIYKGLLQDGSLANGELYYNLGNAYAQLDDIPHAILNYRRAQLFLPRDHQLHANLQYVRAKRADHFAEPETSPVLQTLFFWHYDLSFHSRLWTAVALSILFWLAAVLLLWCRPTWLKATAAILFIGALAFGGSAVASIYSLRHAHPAVIMTPEATPRKGDGHSYATAFDAPIHAGTEVNILRKRGDWYEIALPNHLTGWLPATDLETL